MSILVIGVAGGVSQARYCGCAIVEGVGGGRRPRRAVDAPRAAARSPYGHRSNHWGGSPRHRPAPHALHPRLRVTPIH